MTGSDSDYRNRRRRSPCSPSMEAGRDRRSRNRDDGRHHTKDRLRFDDNRQRRRSSRSPGKDSDRDTRRRRERSDSFNKDRKRRRRSPDEEKSSHRRRHGERDRYDNRDRPTIRRRSRSVDRRSRSRSPRVPVKSRGPLPSQNDAFISKEISKTDSPAPEKEKPNFANTGRLAAESNTVTINGGSVVLKYHEPPEARKPPAKDGWRLYVFKGDDLLEMVPLGERSCWLIGREKIVVDFSIEHPSCSKQHAAIQFRYVEKRNEFGDRQGRVRPYLIDLESANGSMVNGNAIPPGRYVELRHKDVLKFGLSTREYVLMLSTE